MLYVCNECFGPLDVVYDFENLDFDPNIIKDRPKTLWRYKELLPVHDESKIVDLGAGYTPLQRAGEMGRRLDLEHLYVKNDTVNPTYSFKDRPVTVAISKALEFGVDAVGCPSTGNLAAATAAHAAKAGLPCYVLLPSTIEKSKIIQASIYGAKIIAMKGTYDDSNRVASQLAEEYNWAFLNVNTRPYYVEGSKTLAFEICEQLGWSPPDHIIIPVASGALLCAVARGLGELERLGLIEASGVRITGAQPEGCSPIASAFKSHSEDLIPVENPETIAKSLAIGDPGDGIYALRKIRETGGFAESASDEEIVEAIKFLGESEGIFSEPAGGVVIAVLKKLVETGRIGEDERVVCLVTGNGLKTPEAVLGSLKEPEIVEPNIDCVRSFLSGG